jgi:hypothetical protein
MTVVLLPNCTDPKQKKQFHMLKLSKRSDHADMSINNISVMLISKYHHCPEKSVNNIYQNHIPYILKSNTHPFYNFRGPKSRVRIRFAAESWILEK